MKIVTTQITKDHFKKAISQPWTTTTCIVAQVVAEVTGETVKLCGKGGAIVGNEKHVILNFNGAVQDLFDEGWRDKYTEKHSELLNLLPQSITLEIPE